MCYTNHFRHCCVSTNVNMAAVGDVRDILELESNSQEFITKDAIFNDLKKVKQDLCVCYLKQTQLYK